MFDLSWIKYIFSPARPPRWWWIWWGVSLGLALVGGVSYYRFHVPLNSLFLLGYVSTILALPFLGKPQWPAKSTWLFILAVALIYAGLHLPVFAHAPWNDNGLFDDGAWDMAIMRKNIGILPFQSLRFDWIGVIDREQLYHLLMYCWMEIFGYTLRSMNFALMAIGGITIIFVCLAVRTYFSAKLGLVASVILTLQPFHFTHQFLGHRYVIALPCLAATLYFWALLEKSMARSAGEELAPAATKVAIWYGGWSVILLGITVMSAIMGRQVLYALLVVVAGQLIGYGWRHRSALAPLWQRGKLLGRKSFWHEWVSSLRKRKFWPVWPTLAAWGKACGQKIWQDPFQQWVIWGLMLGIVLLPHLCYIFLYPDANYFRREQDLMREFFTQPHLWWWRIGPTLNMLFMPMIGRTFFSRYTLDEALLPFWMWPLWLVGLLGLWRRRRYLLLALNFVPAIGAYVSGPYDFRFFFAVPAWMITMGTGLGILAQAPWIARWWRGSTWLAKFKFGLMLALILMVMFGLCYWGNYSWHFYHDEVYQALGIWGACLFFFAIIWWGMRHYHQAAQPVQAARYYFWQGLGIVGSWIILGAGLTAAAWRLSSLAERPHAFFTLPHHDVGRARMMQDVLRGRSFVQASYHDKDELRPKQRLGPPDTYVGVCSAAYGIVHLFLPRDKTQKFFDFCPGPINVVRWEQVQEQNRKFWLQLSPSTADRYLFLWDFTKAHAPLYSNLRAMRPPGELKLLSSEVDGEEVRIFYLVQTADQFREWQRRLAQDRPPHHGLEIMPTSGDKRRKTF